MDLRANIRRILKRTKSDHKQSANDSASINSSEPPPKSPNVLAGNPADQYTSPSAPPSVYEDTTQIQASDDFKSQSLLGVKLKPSSVRTESDQTSVETLADRNHRHPNLPVPEPNRPVQDIENQPLLVLQQATPTSEDGEAYQHLGSIKPNSVASDDLPIESGPAEDTRSIAETTAAESSASISPATLPPPARPTHNIDREQSLVTASNAGVLQELLPTEDTLAPPHQPIHNPSNPPKRSNEPRAIASMLQRKIWVKRPGASATMVTVREDDLVDDVRDKVLVKYGNSLGRSFDSPDVTLRIVTRTEGSRLQERLLSPEEEMCRTLDTYYPGGQTVEEALIIDIPPKKTPRPSPRNHYAHAAYHATDDYRPQESGTDYFPPMPAAIAPTNAQTVSIHDARAGLPPSLHLPEHTRSISVLQTGQVPPLPSPGAASRRRPKYVNRQHTSSPTILSHGTASGAVAVHPPHLAAPPQIPHRSSVRHRSDSTTSDRPNGVPPAPPLPTPPAPEAPPTAKAAGTPPTPGPHLQPRAPRPRKGRNKTPTNGTAQAGKTGISSLLDGSVPPINVLIVEDNIINLKLLEAFMKRLKVRWSTAMNGQIAVNKWRTGGFHLVLMDIQLPIMSGLEATKEIRRLERVNGIGVFSSITPSTEKGEMASLDAKVDGEEEQDGESEERQKEKEEEKAKDKLDMEDSRFKSPVIIVALTASSLQSDRHEALAAGCNDFLTKPVNFVWLERKVKEWGCMQALIDFDGWRKWKDFSSLNPDGKAGAKVGSKSPLLDGVSKADLAAKAKEKKTKRDKRISTDGMSSANAKNHGSDNQSEATAAAVEVGG